MLFTVFLDDKATLHIGVSFLALPNKGLKFKKTMYK